ncbi:MAG: 16S rRNA (guanine(527)-N(7))-methyltransferase RsmG [Bacilli bacterium]|jgi:16S rRNA (guanine527-N7)-methyltransferase
MDRLQFENWLKQNYPQVTPKQIAQFETYRELIVTWNQAVNLMSRADGLDLYEKHFVDSLLFPLPEDGKHRVYIDLGTGAGFPGIPLKIMYPDYTFYLLEATGKRADFLRRVINGLELMKIEIVNDRAEAYASFSRETFDGLVARAVSPLNILLELAAPLVKPNGLIYAYKGDRADVELVEASFAMRVLSLKLVEHQLATLPLLGHNRHRLVFEKTAPTIARYPRPYSEIKRKPL